MSMSPTYRLKKAYKKIEHLESVIAKLKHEIEDKNDFINKAFIAHPNLDRDIYLIDNNGG